MYETKDSESNPTKYATTVERKSERELVVTRTFNGPAHIVFDAWIRPTSLGRVRLIFHNRVVAGPTPCDARHVTPKSQI
jgi:hypothetical protein